MPIIALPRWPPMSARGCAASAPVKAKRKTVEPPRKPAEKPNGHQPRAKEQDLWRRRHPSPTRQDQEDGVVYLWKFPSDQTDSFRLRSDVRTPPSNSEVEPFVREHHRTLSSQGAFISLVLFRNLDRFRVNSDIGLSASMIDSLPLSKISTTLFRSLRRRWAGTGIRRQVHEALISL